MVIEFVLDASPWGIGGILTINGHMSEYLYEYIPDEVAKLLCVDIGSSSSQQAFEALAVLVSLRVWSHLWRGRRTTIFVRSDSVSALILTLRLKTSGTGTGIIAQELAIDMARGVYRPQVVQHVPGIANKSADILSRMHQPDTQYTIPADLAKLPRKRYNISCSNFVSVAIASRFKPRCTVE